MNEHWTVKVARKLLWLCYSQTRILCRLPYPTAKLWMYIVRLGTWLDLTEHMSVQYLFILYFVFCQLCVHACVHALLTRF